jgi:outer membrane immunogenic protein
MKSHWFGAAVVGAVAQLTAVGAFAADLPAAPAYTKAPPVAASYSWAGFYVGGNAGFGWGAADHNWNLTLNSNPIFNLPPSGMAGSDTNSLSGPFGGLQAGYNWQMQNMLAGIETDIQAPGRTKNNTFLGTNIFANGDAPTTTTITYTDKLLWFGTLRARAGVIAGDRWLVYGTGGLAYGRVAVEGITSIPPSTVFGAASVPATPFELGRTAVGWTIGGGIENALGNNWSWKAEYLYLNFGSITGSYPVPVTPGVTCTGTPTGCFAVFSASGAATSRISDNIVRVGVNYKFGGQ